MIPYRTRGNGPSGVVAYEPFEDSIDVYFKGTGAYGYRVAECGRITIETMKQLANNQQGLQTFINQHKPPYYKKG